MANSDFFTVTTTEEYFTGIMDQLLPVLAHLNMASMYDGLYKLHSGGTLKTGKTYGSAHQLSASGDFIRALQGEQLWHEYLAIVGDWPHRVTTLHIAHDVACHAPTELRRFRDRVERGEIQLTRKKLDLETQYTTILSQDRRGHESGTVYIGPRKPQTAKLRVYDKAKEQYDKRRLEIPDTLRWELILGRKANLSLQDAYDPDPVFWHYMAAILPAPGGVPQWAPCEGGFTLPSRVTFLPAESMKRLVDTNDIFPKLYALCDQVGPNGIDYLLRLLKDRYKPRTVNPAMSNDPAVRSAS